MYEIRNIKVVGTTTGSNIARLVSVISLLFAIECQPYELTAATAAGILATAWQIAPLHCWRTQLPPAEPRSINAFISAASQYNHSTRHGERSILQDILISSLVLFN